MAEVLTPAKGLWAVDKLILAYLAATATVWCVYWPRFPEAPVSLALHFGAAALILLAARWTGRFAWYFRHWYPLPLVGSCYKEMAILIPVVRGWRADQWLAGLDFSIWHANPTVWLERIQTPGFTELVQAAYTLFVPAVLLVPWLLWRSGRFREFRYCAFLIALGFLVSYVGYLVVPARGPRFLLDSLQHKPLEGLWLFHWMRTVLDQLESAHYDCFPSGHVELTVLAWWMSRQISKQLGWVYFAYTFCIVFATVYLRYHYTVDLLAGALTAATLIAVAPAMYRALSGGKAGMAGKERNQLGL